MLHFCVSRCCRPLLPAACCFFPSPPAPWQHEWTTGGRGPHPKVKYIFYSFVLICSFEICVMTGKVATLLKGERDACSSQQHSRFPAVVVNSTWIKCTNPPCASFWCMQVLSAPAACCLLPAASSPPLQPRGSMNGRQGGGDPTLKLSTSFIPLC